MKSLFRELLLQDLNVVSSEDIYKMYPDLNQNAVQAKIKRCLRGGELVRLYKGIYAVNNSYSHRAIAEEQVARAIDPSAYLSGIAALRFHNLIPEIVNFKTFFGAKKVKVNTKEIHFEIKKVDPEQTSFGVEEIMVGGSIFRVADPLRAIFDTFVSLKTSPKTRGQICTFLRIDEEESGKINWNNAKAYAGQIKGDLAQSIATAMRSEAK
jgi:predicted transcriptional regulator of viral defense system